MKPAEFLLKKARARAARDMLPCTLTVADIEAVWPEDGCCPALDIPLSRGTGFVHDGSPTLDRLRNNAGYVAGNIAVLSLKANRAKGHLTADELEQIAAWMRRNGLD